MIRTGVRTAASEGRLCFTHWRTPCISACVVLVLWGALGFAGDPDARFFDPRLLRAADPGEPGPLIAGPIPDSPLWDGSHPRPIGWAVWVSSANVLDVTQDGLKDLVIQTDVFPHSGRYQGDVPIFEKRRKLSEFFVYDEPEGGLSPAYPDGWTGTNCFADLNGDGVDDIVTCTKVGPFRWWKGTGQQGKRRAFKYQGKLIEASAGAPLRPLLAASRSPSFRVADWDGDGLPDLIVGIRLVDYRSPLQIKPPGGWSWGNAYAGKTWLGGDSLGALVFHKNVGTREKPKFTLGIPFRIGQDQRLALFYDAVSPEVLDFDGDGLLDILVCTFDRLVLYRNVGSRTRPRLADGTLLKVGKPETLPFQRLTLVLANWKKGDRNHLLFCSDQLMFHVQNTSKTPRPHYQLAGPLLTFDPPLVVDAEAIPHVSDWNGDGRPDLLVGCEDGFITYFENVSTAKPAGLHFRHGKLLTVGKQPLRVLSDYGMTGRLEGLWGYANPITVDWDGDGDLDILTGSTDPSIDYFQNLGTRTKPRLAAATKITVDGAVLPHDWRSRPTADDWNGDGLIDLMVATRDGRLRYYERVRKDGALSLKTGRVMHDPKGKPLYLRGSEDRSGGRVKLSSVDWDKDGDLDLLVGSRNGSPNPGWLENRGTNREPVFQPHPLAPPQVGGHFRMLEPYDWDHDGDLDVLIGSDSGGIFYVERK